MASSKNIIGLPQYFTPIHCWRFTLQAEKNIISFSSIWVYRWVRGLRAKPLARLIGKWVARKFLPHWSWYGWDDLAMAGSTRGKFSWLWEIRNDCVWV